MIAGDRYETRLNHFAREVSAIEASHGCHSDGNCRTFNVDIALGRRLIDAQMNDAAVFIAFLNNIILYFDHPIGLLFFSI
jgi:hypothetical protein